ncbi:cytochrome P450 2C1-like [Asterias amurensis]|uniref:cytochrome P450 2C1-like n=1 Tax=Asterias amurensis TaxID=7602 RepID=UPI003AB7269A
MEGVLRDNMHAVMHRTKPVAFLFKFLERLANQSRSFRSLACLSVILAAISVRVSRRRKQREAQLKSAVAKLKRLQLPPGPWGWPILGIIPSLDREAPQYTIAEMSKTYGPVVSFRLGSHLVVVLNDYDSIREAFVKSGDIFSDRPRLTMFNEVHEGMPGGGIVLSFYENHWKEQRRFALKALRSLGMGRATMESKICTEARHIVQSFDEQKGEPFRSAKITGLAVSNIICQLTVGRRWDYGDPYFLRIVSHMMYLFEEMGVNASNVLPWLKYVPGSGYRRLLEVRSVIREEFYIPQVREHVRTFDPNNIRDFTDAYLQEYYLKYDSVYASNEDAVIAALADLFGAGTDTTETVIDWFLKMMIKRPDVQEKLQQEMDDVVGRHRLPQWSDRSKLHYMQATLNEVLRYTSAGPFGVPHSPIEDTEFRGYYIPKEAVVIANIHAVLYNPDVFPEPDVFRPSRFLDAEGKFFKHEHMIQFGIGRRGCIGEQLAQMELFTFITHIFHQFTLTAPDGNPENVSLASHLGLSKNALPYELRATRRKNSDIQENARDMI